MNGAAPFTGVVPFLRKTEVSNYSHKGLCVEVLHKVRPYIRQQSTDCYGVILSSVKL